jgi:hypothetical protein
MYMTKETSPIDEVFTLLLLDDGYDICRDMATSTNGESGLEAKDARGMSAGGSWKYGG